jgi:large subunit ribosomal protein L21
MTYAIIEFGGKQYRVEKGDSVLVDRVREKEGAKLSPRALLYSGDGKEQAVFDGAALAKIKVEAVVAEHVKGEKIRVFKYRPKKRYRKTHGHRSLLSRIEIREIHGPSAGKPAAGSEKQPSAAKAAAGSEKQPSAAKAAAGSRAGRGKAKDEEGE